MHARWAVVVKWREREREVRQGGELDHGYIKASMSHLSLLLPHRFQQLQHNSKLSHRLSVSVSAFHESR
jgi:hypothetical protein